MQDLVVSSRPLVVSSRPVTTYDAMPPASTCHRPWFRARSRTRPTPRFTARGTMKRTSASLRIERQYRHVIATVLAGRMPNCTHERHVHVATVVHHLPYGRELMHLGLHLPTMAHRHGIPEKYRPDSTDRWWDRLDGALPDPAHFADLPGGACGAQE